MAGALLGLGAAAKIYPGFFVLPLILDRVAARDGRGAVRVGAAAAGAWLAVNLPFLIINPSGWWATYRYQAGRPSDITTNSIWSWGFPGLTGRKLNAVTIVLIAACWLAALGVGWWRRGPDGYPWIAVSAAMLCAFLLFNKVNSPQYALWLLPFFVLTRLRWGWWVAYVTIDLSLFVGLYRWYYDITQGGDFGVAKQAAIVGIWGRAAVLALLFVVFLITPPAVRPAMAPARPPADRGGPPDSGYVAESRGEAAEPPGEGAEPASGGLESTVQP